MSIMKKTIIIHPIMDSYVKKLKEILKEKGYEATYSMALNYMLLYQIYDIQHRRIHPKVKMLLQSFLNDNATIKEIQDEDLFIEYQEKNRKLIGEHLLV